MNNGLNVNNVLDLYKVHTNPINPTIINERLLVAYGWTKMIEDIMYNTLNLSKRTRDCSGNSKRGGLYNFSQTVKKRDTKCIRCHSKNLKNNLGLITYIIDPVIPNYVKILIMK